MNDFYENLKDGRCTNCKYAKVVYGGNWSFLGCYSKPYKGKWVSRDKRLPDRERKYKR